MNVMKNLLIGIATLSLAGCIASCTGKQQAESSDAQEAAVVSYDTIEGVSAMTLKDGSQVIWLKDNAGDKMNSRELFADAPDALIDSLGLADGMPASISTFLLKTEGKTVLFDAGLGPKMGGHMAERLESIGLSTDSIDIVFLTHLHTDHIGGLMGEEGPLFADAEIYVGAVEYDAWMNQMSAEQAGLQQAIMSAYADQLRQFAFGDTLPCGVVAIDAVGHTPGHTVFQKDELLVIGDLMHGLALQESHPEYCANFDMDKERSVESRKRILDYARQNGLIMAGMHMPAPGFVIR